MIDVDVKVSDPPHRRIFQVGVTVQPADADDTSVFSRDEDGFTWLVETVPARLPVSQEAGESMEAGRFRLRHKWVESVDRQTVDSFNCDHAFRCSRGSVIPFLTRMTFPIDRFDQDLDTHQHLCHD
jgi:hypothetical protein